MSYSASNLSLEASVHPYHSVAPIVMRFKCMHIAWFHEKARFSFFISSPTNPSTGVWASIFSRTMLVSCRRAHPLRSTPPGIVSGIPWYFLTIMILLVLGPNTTKFKAAVTPATRNEIQSAFSLAKDIGP